MINLLVFECSWLAGPFCLFSMCFFCGFPLRDLVFSHSLKTCMSGNIRVFGDSKLDVRVIVRLSVSLWKHCDELMTWVYPIPLPMTAVIGIISTMTLRSINGYENECPDD